MKWERSAVPCPAVRAMSWTALMKQCPHGHLVTAAPDGLDPLSHTRSRPAGVLKQLASAISRRGFYAMTTLCDPEVGDCVMIAFQDREDARRFAQAVDARALPPFGRWRSYSSVLFDAEAKARIDEYLAGRRAIRRTFAGTA